MSFVEHWISWFNFNHEIHENWYPKNNIESTVWIANFKTNTRKQNINIFLPIKMINFKTTCVRDVFNRYYSLGSWCWYGFENLIEKIILFHNVTEPIIAKQAKQHWMMSPNNNHTLLNSFNLFSELSVNFLFI